MDEIGPSMHLVNWIFFTDGNYPLSSQLVKTKQASTLYATF